jgi:hypothetical protein
VAISGQPMIHGVSERGVVVVVLWLDRAGGDPPAAPGIVVTGPVSAGPGTITVAGIARPFEADLGVSIEDASGRPVEAVYSGSTDRGTIGASGYGVETSDWTEAWAPFAVGAEGLAPGDYTMVLDARGGGESPGGPRALHLPFSITERGREPALATAAELDVVRALVDWAGAGRDAGGASDAVAPPLATEVTLHLGLQQTTAATRAELDDPATWVFGAETFNGRRGDFSPLAYLAGAGPLRVTSGPIPHCAGPPLDWPAELDGLRQVNVEPVGASSCVSWFAVSLFLDPSGRISAVALDLWEP